MESMLGAATIAFRATFPLVYVRQCRQRRPNVTLNSQQKPLDFFKLTDKPYWNKMCNKCVFCCYIPLHHNTLGLFTNTQNVLKTMNISSFCEFLYEHGDIFFHLTLFYVLHQCQHIPCLFDQYLMAITYFRPSVFSQLHISKSLLDYVKPSIISAKLRDANNLRKLYNSINTFVFKPDVSWMKFYYISVCALTHIGIQGLLVILVNGSCDVFPIFVPRASFSL